MTEQDEFPRQVVTLETLTRGDAMRAASEWAGKIRYDAANEAAWRHREHEDRAFATAQNALSEFTELPPDSTSPEVAEMCWRLRVQLHANAIGITYEKADANLREDFKRYIRLMDAVLKAWQLNDFTRRACSMPSKEYMEFLHFWCNECGWNAGSEPIEFLENLHTKVCIHKQ